MNRKRRPAALETDAMQVAEVAARSGLSEYAVFACAYAHWHGNDAPPAVLERRFAHYLHSGAAPPWVRHYCRAELRRPFVDRAAPWPARSARRTALVGVFLALALAAACSVFYFYTGIA